MFSVFEICAAIYRYRPGALWVVLYGWCSVAPELLRILVAALVLDGRCSIMLQFVSIYRSRPAAICVIHGWCSMMPHAFSPWCSLGGDQWPVLYHASFVAIARFRPGAVWALPHGWCSTMPYFLRVLMLAMVLMGGAKAGALCACEIWKLSVLPSCPWLVLNGRCSFRPWKMRLSRN